MEAQLHHPQDAGLHTGEGQGQVHDEGEHHNKRSVLKKVKARAKKIKDTLKHGLGHEHEHEHEHEHGREHHPLQGEHGVDEEEEETDDEEMEEGAEVHGGPYAIRSKDIPEEDIVGKQTANLENPTSPKEDRYDAKTKNEDVHRPSLQRQDEFARPPSVGEKTRFPIEMQRRPPVAETKGIDHGPQGHENIGGASTGGDKIKGNDHEEAVFRGDMHNPRSALGEHRAKGVDHEITGLEPAPPHFRGEHKPPAAAERDANKGIDLVTGHGKLENQGLQGHETGAIAGMKEDPHAPKDPIVKPNDSNYQSKVTNPTGANNEEAGVSPLVRSFEEMGVDDAPETTTNQAAWQLGAEGGGTGDTKLDQGAEHSQYTGSHDQFAPQETPSNFPPVPKDTESLPKSMDPSKPEDSPQDTLTGKPGSYTEKISSAITDKAVAAKNVVASKLGYGGTDEGTNKSPVTGGDKDATKTTSTAELAHKAAGTVATKLAPVYEKVAGAGSAVMAKVQGTATGVAGNKSGENVGTEQEGHTTNATDKGVSMKEYLAEKFKPGEEDKALSEVISGSLSRQKEKTEETGEPKLMGKVTESKEVERKLGPIEDPRKEDGDGGSGGTTQGEGFGQGVVDRVKDVVSKWLGKGGETQTSPGISIGSGAGGGDDVGGRGE